MRQKISSFSVLTIFICLALIGLSLIPFLSVQLTPSSIPSSIKVNYSWRGASAKVIEHEVTSRLEGMFNGIKGVRELSSSSGEGSGNVNIRFKKNVDMDAARFEVANLIRQSYPKLPEGVSYPQLSMNVASESSSPILSYSINANQSPYFIKKYVENHITPRLSILEGVNQVSVYGAAPYEWVITYDADKLFQLQLSVNEISGAINTFFTKNELGKANVLSDGNDFSNQISVQLAYQPSQEINWERIPVGKAGGRLVYLGDLAKVRFQEGAVNAYYRINGLNTINMVLYPEKGINNIHLAEKLKKAVENIKEDISADYHVELVRDPTAQLNEEIEKIQLRSFFSLLILLILTTLIYRDGRYLGVLFLSITVNLLLAVIFYYFLQVDLQLYSFAGITISFGIIIDNTIIMMDHLRKRGNKKAFLAILAATLTTIGAVAVIFLLEESQRANLWDFALVIAINLGVSLLVAYYFVPALMEKLKLREQGKKISTRRKRRIANSTWRYYQILNILKKPVLKWSLLVVVLLGFGIPLHLAPDKLEGEGAWAGVYNKTIGSEFFSNDMRPGLEKYIGGSLRLFTENVFEKSHYSEPGRTSLLVRGAMPEGNTIDQLNEVVQKMEHYIASFQEVELFETRITSYRNATINIFFKEPYESSGFPHTMKSLLESRVTSLGGLDWSVSGVGRGFSNALGSGYKSDRIELQGYNYENLYRYAEMLSDSLIKSSNGRVKEVEISSGGWNSSPLFEYYLEFDPELISLAGVSRFQLYNELRNQLHSGRLPSIVKDQELQQVKLLSDRYEKMNVWDLKNAPLVIGGKQFKLRQLASIVKKKTGNSIQKKNQQFQLTAAFDFIGPRPLADKFKKDRIEAMSLILPIGYQIKKSSFSGWNKEDKQQYYVIFVIVAIIFFICAILLESLLQPLAIIAMIPISFIGVFLTFYLFEFNFDQGGYASFILLCGISVNAALYIVNDINNLKKEYPGRDNFRIYLKAYNNKIIPILITIISTIAGLLPFVWGGQQEVFWFSFAVGSIGGLLFSLIGILIYLPLLVVKAGRKNN